MLLLALLLWLVTPRLPLFDFTLFWKALEHLVNGHNPYSLPPYSSFVDADLRAVSPSGISLPSLSSPAALGLFWFFGKLPMEAAKDVYQFIMCLAFCWTAWLGYRMVARERVAGAFRGRILFLLALPLGLFYQAMIWGSVTLFCLIAICALILLRDSKRVFWTGFILALCCIKPHLFILLFLYVALWSRANRVLSLAFGFFSALGSMLATGLYFQPALLRMYYDVFRQGLPFNALTNASMGSIVFDIFGRNCLAGMFIPLIVGCLALLLWMHRRGTGHFALVSVCILPWSILLSPYSWGHDYVVCFPVGFLLAAYHKRNVREGHRTHAAVSLSLLALIFVCNLISPAFSRQWMFVAFGFLYAAAAALLLFDASRCYSKPSGALICGDAEPAAGRQLGQSG